MPDTFTPGGLLLIGNGERSGTWGTVTNTNMQILGRMISQAGTIALSGTTHTLTVSDGVLSDGHYAVLVFGGSPSGTNTVTINPNDAKRTFFVKNDSGQSVVLTQGSGGDVTVADGKTAIVYCDGAGSGAAVVDITANLAIAGLVTETGTQTLTNKTLTSPTLTSPTLTSPTLTAPVVNGPVTGDVVLSEATWEAGTSTTEGVVSPAKVAAAIAALGGGTYTAGGGIGLTGEEFSVAAGGGLTQDADGVSHADTSTQASVDNSGATVIQDVTLDTYGHVTALGSTTLALTDLGVTASASTLNTVSTPQAEAVWEAGTGTTESAVSPAKVAAAIAALGSSGWTESAVQNATGQTSVNFTSLPTGLSEIEVLFYQLSANVGLQTGVQLSVGGVFATSGYQAEAQSQSSIYTSSSQMTFILTPDSVGASGVMRFYRFSSNTWISEHNLGGTNGSSVAGNSWGGGSVTLGGELDGLRLWASPQNYDAGQVKIRYRT
jgi:hypothetical protein